MVRRKTTRRKTTRRKARVGTKRRKTRRTKTAWQKKFAKAATGCHKTTTSPKAFGSCMRRELKKRR
jgi:hypothetical protein